MPLLICTIPYSLKVGSPHTQNSIKCTRIALLSQIEGASQCWFLFPIVAKQITLGSTKARQEDNTPPLCFVPNIWYSKVYCFRTCRFYLVIIYLRVLTPPLPSFQGSTMLKAACRQFSQLAEKQLKTIKQNSFRGESYLLIGLSFMNVIYIF